MMKRGNRTHTKAGRSRLSPVSYRSQRLATARAMASLPAMSSVGIRYAEARPSAAAIIAACWSGGVMQTSFREVRAALNIARHAAFSALPCCSLLSRAQGEPLQ
jgi:hypothetical protein